MVSAGIGEAAGIITAGTTAGATEFWGLASGGVDVPDFSASSDCACCADPPAIGAVEPSWLGILDVNRRMHGQFVEPPSLRPFSSSHRIAGADPQRKPDLLNEFAFLRRFGANSKELTIRLHRVVASRVGNVTGLELALRAGDQCRRRRSLLHGCRRLGSGHGFYGSAAFIRPFVCNRSAISRIAVICAVGRIR